MCCRLLFIKIPFVRIYVSDFSLKKTLKCQFTITKGDCENDMLWNWLQFFMGPFTEKRANVAYSDALLLKHHSGVWTLITNDRYRFLPLSDGELMWLTFYTWFLDTNPTVYLNTISTLWVHFVLCRICNYFCTTHDSCAATMKLFCHSEFFFELYVN